MKCRYKECNADTATVRQLGDHVYQSPHDGFCWTHSDEYDAVLDRYLEMRKGYVDAEHEQVKAALADLNRFRSKCRGLERAL